MEIIKPFPFALYEWTKFSPGLMGLWLEIGQSSPGANKEIATICNLNPPVVLNLSGKIASECQFFKQYWEECFNLSNM